MKKTYLAFICAALLLLSACGGAPASTPTPEPSEPPAASTLEPEAPPADTAEPTGETKDFTLSIEGADVTVTMTLTELSASNCPAVTMYVDTELFLTREFEGECDVAPVDGDGDPLGSIHLGYFGVSPDIKAEETLNENYGYRLYTDEGMTTLGGYDAYHLSFTSADDSDGPFSGGVYYIPCGEGTLCVDIFCKDEAAETMLPRLLLMADTLKIK